MCAALREACTSVKSARKVAYADRRELEQEIIRRHVACVDADGEAEAAAPPVQGGMAHTPVKEAAPKVKAPVRVE